MTAENDAISFRDVEFNTYEEMKAFIKGIRYEFVEHVDVCSVAYHDMPEQNGAYTVSLSFQFRKGMSSVDRLARMTI